MWDIHGNALAKGHCEIHSHIAEEYPCHLCMEEQQVAYVHDRAAQIVDYNAPLEDKMHQVRSMAGLTADQYTVNLLGHIQEDIEQLQQKVKNQAVQLREQQQAIERLKEAKFKLSKMADSRKETIKQLRKQFAKRGRI